MLKCGCHLVASGIVKGFKEQESEGEGKKVYGSFCMGPKHQVGLFLCGSFNSLLKSIGFRALGDGVLKDRCQPTP